MGTVDQATGEIVATPEMTTLSEGLHGTGAQKIAFLSAMSVVQGEVSNVVKDQKNAHLKNSYASLAAVLDGVRPVLAKHGMACLQSPSNGMLVSMLSHKDGGMHVSHVPLLLSKQDMQNLGSAITYARRYSLSALLGIAQEDDDGSGASGAVQAGSSQAGNQSGSSASAQNQTPFASKPAPSKATGGFGKITDVNAPVVQEALKKVKSKATLKELDEVLAFAKTKYGDDALKAIDEAIGQQRQALVVLGSTPADNPVSV